MAVIDTVVTSGSFVFTAQLRRLSPVTGLVEAFIIPPTATVCAAIVDLTGTSTNSIALSSAFVGADWPTSLVGGEFDGSETVLLTPGRTVDLQISVDDGTTVNARPWIFKGVFDVELGVVSC